MALPSRFFLFGAFRCRAAASAHPLLRAPRLQLLVAYLLLHRGESFLRRHLAFQLWPDSSEAQAHTNLRNLLFQLRRIYPEADAMLSRTNLSVGWCAEDPALYSLDVADFVGLLAAAELAREQGDSVQEIGALQRAVALYADDLLTGWYEEWVIVEREHYRQRYLAALARLVALLREGRRYEETIQYAQLLVEREPLYEPGYVELMQLHALCGNRVAAIQVYRRLAHLLEEELGVEPGPPAQELYRRLAVAEVPTIEPDPARGRGLIGRAREWQALQEAWSSAARGRPSLVLVEGDPGIGKTRLIEELQAWLEERPGLHGMVRCWPSQQECAYTTLISWLRCPSFRATLQRLSPPARSTAGHLLPELLDQRAAPAPPAVGPGPCQPHLDDTLAQVVLNAPRPLVLLIDSAHWCDLASLLQIGKLLHASPGGQLLVVAVVQSGQLTEQHPLTPALSDLCASVECVQLTLPALSLAETTELGARLLRRPLSTAEAAELYGETEGNPLFIVEQARVCRDTQARAVGGGEPLFELGQGLTPRLSALLAARLASLSPLARRVAGVIAAFDRPVWWTELEGVHSDLGEDQLAEAFDELWQRRIVVETSAGSYAFSHGKLREATYERLSPALRQLYRRRIPFAKSPARP